MERMDRKVVTAEEFRAAAAQSAGAVDGRGQRLDPAIATARALGTDPAHLTVRAAYTAEVVSGAPDAPDARSVSVIISTESVDRERDSIKIDGWDLAAYRRNPIVLWAHDYRSLPIGRGADVRAEDARLKARIDFTPPGVNAMADTVLAMMRTGFLSGISVGFRPLEMAFNEERRGVDFLAQELLEFSVVPVPANAECLVEARAAGVDVGPLRAWATKILDQLGPEERVARLGFGDVILPEVRIEGTADGVRKVWALGRFGPEERVLKQEGPTLDLASAVGVLADMARDVADIVPLVAGAPAEAQLYEAVGRLADLDDDLDAVREALLEAAEPAAPGSMAMAGVGQTRAGETTIRRSRRLSVGAFDLTAYKAALLKRGRVLSAANERRLREAAEAADASSAKIREVVAQVEAAPEADSDSASDEPTRQGSPDSDAKAVSLYQAGLRHAKALAASGDVSDGAWSFSAADGNVILGDPPDWDRYASWHLGHDAGADAQTKAAWKYPFGKGGKLYKAALRAIASRAAQQGAGAISDAASALLASLNERASEPAEAAGGATPPPPEARGKAGEARRGEIDEIFDIDLVNDPDIIELAEGLTAADVRALIVGAAAEMGRQVRAGLSRELAVARGRVD